MRQPRGPQTHPTHTPGGGGAPPTPPHTPGRGPPDVGEGRRALNIDFKDSPGQRLPAPASPASPGEGQACESPAGPGGAGWGAWSGRKIWEGGRSGEWGRPSRGGGLLSATFAAQTRRTYFAPMPRWRQFGILESPYFCTIVKSSSVPSPCSLIGAHGLRTCVCIQAHRGLQFCLLKRGFAFLVPRLHS